MQFGLSTFGEVIPEAGRENAVNAHCRIQEIIAEARLADELGLDVYAVLAQIISGPISHEKLLRSIELFATKVAPVKKRIAAIY